MITANAVGRIGKDAESRTVGDTSVTSFSMAVDTQKKGQDGKMIANWYSVDIWGKRGDTLKQYLTKGSLVAVTGGLEMQTFTDAQGQVKTKPVIKVDNLKLCGGGQQQAAPAAQKPAAPPPPKAAVKEDLDAIFASEDSIPF